jgi:hypothetical protein
MEGDKPKNIANGDEMGWFSFALPSKTLFKK